MPAYAFQCNTCGHLVDNVIFKITEYDEKTLKDEPCRQSSGDGACPGTYEHTFEKPVSFSFKGGAPTPKFHNSANQG